MATKLVKCPGCARPTEYRLDNPFRPFCSERCKLIDLGAWAEEKYAIAGGGGGGTVEDDLRRDPEQMDDTPDGNPRIRLNS